MKSGLTILMLLSAIWAQGQLLEPIARLDTNVIRIGEQAVVDLSISYRVDEGDRDIEFPVILDTLTSMIEVLSSSPVDSVLQSPDGDPYLFEKRQQLHITSWDSGYWAIPPFKFVVNGDTLETEAFLFEVRTVPVDTSMDFREIVEIETLPFSTVHWLKQNWPWIAGSAGLLLALVALVFWLKRPKETVKEVEVPTVPLHVRTLTALEEVESRKLWQKGHVKLYYSEVTDILRGYLEERYHIPALERTTHELSRELKLSPLGTEQQRVLINMLQLADMVKFAKMKPGVVENEALLSKAFRFVQETSFDHRDTDTQNGA